MRTSESTKGIGPAVTKALAALSNPAMKGVNPHFKSKFAKLCDILTEVRPILGKYGLAVIQSAGDGPSVTTMLVHESGEWIESEPLVMTPGTQGPQGCMAALTYARRGSLCAMLGIAGEDDDDGNSAQGGGESRGQSSGRKEGGTRGRSDKPSIRNPDGPPSEKQLGFLHKLIGEHYPSGDGPFRLWLDDNYGTSSTKTLTKGQVSEIIDRMTANE